MPPRPADDSVNGASSAVTQRTLPVPEHLGGGVVDDPGPAPMDIINRRRRIAWRAQAARKDAARRIQNENSWRFYAMDQSWSDAWAPHEIEECQRFARIPRDE
jgi:hypothetical protein